MHKYKSAGKKNWTTGECDIYICCSVVQNGSKVVDNHSSPLSILGMSSSSSLPCVRWL